MLTCIKRDSLTNNPIFDLNSITVENTIKEDVILDIKKTDNNIEIISKEKNQKHEIIQDTEKSIKLDELFDFIGEHQPVEKIYGKNFHQMTKEERLYLMQVKDNLLRRKSIYFGQHALDRMEERYIKEKDIIKAIRNGQIIEYRENANDKVIAIRGCTLNRRKENVYVILSITTGKIITTYSNKHWTTYTKQYNLDKYIPNFEIIIPEYYKKLINLYYI